MIFLFEFLFILLFIPVLLFSCCETFVARKNSLGKQTLRSEKFPRSKVTHSWRGKLLIVNHGGKVLAKAAAVVGKATRINSSAFQRCKPEIRQKTKKYYYYYYCLYLRIHSITIM